MQMRLSELGLRADRENYFLAQLYGQFMLIAVAEQ